MKRYLLLFTIMASTVLGKSQAVLNEVYFNPAAGESEYIELYNSGAFDNLDCYTLLSLYDDGTNKGFYVINFPDIDLVSNHFSVLASSMGFTYQGGQSYSPTVRDFSWNDLNQLGSTGYFKQFKLVNGSWEEVNPPINTNDILTTLPSSYGAKYVILLYRNGILVNALSINGTNGVVPIGLSAMPDLTVPTDGTCAPFDAEFSLIQGDEMEYMQPAIGNSNGAMRTSDGKCGTWQKSSSNSDNTPGSSNGPSTITDNTIIAVEGGLLGCELNQDGKRTAYYRVANSTSSEAFPLVLQLYQDNGSVTGQLDAGDTFVEQQVLANPDYTTYDEPLPYTNYGILVVAKATSGCYQTIREFDNNCAPLPVKFSSFTASRNKNNVAIKWETSTEINNRGFYIQRNINGSWENIAFVFSKADNGNSNSVLSYYYNDLNTAKGVSQYRIQQVDMDGKARYSEIRSVRGEANISKLLVYPNPTTSGNVNVVFEDQSPKNVTVLDMSGRMIKQYRNVINNVSVDNLENGIYSIQVTDVSTATISVEKVVVKKR